MQIMRGIPGDKPPVFPLLMSFAAKRHGISYRTFASNSSALAEAQLKAAEMFGLDAVTACSDAFRVSADYGGAVVFPEDGPPYLSEPLIKNAHDIKQIKKKNIFCGSRMTERARSVKEMAHAAGGGAMVLGWVDMPFAEACSFCGVQNFMLMLYDEPKLAHDLLSFLTEIVIEFSSAQLEYTEMVGAGDAAASLVSAAQYREFALPYEQRVAEAAHKAGGMVKLHICGDTLRLLPDIVKSGCDLFNVDHMVPLDEAAKIYAANKKAFKGNADPVLLLTQTPDECFETALRCIKTAEGMPYMLSAGCEIPAGITDENFAAFISAANYQEKNRKALT